MVSQALMPKRCNVLLETAKESPPLQVLEKKGVGLCHDQTVSRRLALSGNAKPVGASLLAIASGQSISISLCGRHRQQAGSHRGSALNRAT
jgi:hypothetical protein